MISASASGNRNDVASAFIPLVERPIAGRDELLKGCRRNGNFTVAAFRPDEDEPAAQINGRRVLGEITLVHPDSLLRPHTSGRGNKAGLSAEGNDSPPLIGPFLPTALSGRPTAVTLPTLELAA